ncbi:MAG: hypothetical protein JW800_01565 [Candidatus Omnitrophica bacterium]|nr:hypothetical protein [Candidatus Omnitrophota bacterium]
MKKHMVVLMCMFLVAGFMLAGCGAKKAESSKAAIDISKGMKTTEEKVDYLIGQAKAFYNSKEFQNAVDTAQYVLRYLDRESVEAANLFKQAKKALEAEAQGALENIKKSLGQ